MKSFPNALIKNENKHLLLNFIYLQTIEEKKACSLFWLLKYWKITKLKYFCVFPNVLNWNTELQDLTNVICSNKNQRKKEKCLQQIQKEMTSKIQLKHTNRVANSFWRVSQTYEQVHEHTYHTKNQDKKSKTTQISSLPFYQSKQGEDKPGLAPCLWQKGEGLKVYTKASLCDCSESVRVSDSRSVGLQKVRRDSQSRTMAVWKKREVINLKEKFEDDT